ncbi:MAG TPA: TolC family protein [Kofleriaceae bacterium]|nr:TolC family protein [Kofleriaceae bacterium]
MSRYARARLVYAAASLLFCASAARAGSLTIDLPTAIARARERAPEAIAALTRIGEADAARAGARILFSQNPELEIGAGPRLGTPRTTQLEARIAQRFEPGRRGARIRVAEAGVQHARALGAAELRALDFAVATAFYEARAAELAVLLAQRGQELASRAAEAAERRRKAGDLTDLGVDLARIALGRARSAVAAAEAERAEALGRLGALIGAAPGEALALAGELRPPPLTLDELRAAVPLRADVRALDAESRLARAEEVLAAAAGRPELGAWLGYERDAGDTIVLGGISVTLPLWNRAQGDQEAARARARGAERERTAVVAAASRQVVDAFEAYTRAREAVLVLERDVLPALADAEQLLERSIESGQLAIHDYLVARQEILGGRREHLDRQLALAKAAAAARFVAGAAP